MGYRFSLVLSREITHEESAILQETGCADASFTTDSLPTNAEVTVTKMDFDDTTSPSLAEAIESALEAVKKVPELSVPGLTVPAQPAHAPTEAPAEVQAETEAAAPAEVLEGAVVGKEPGTKVASARKPRARKVVVGKLSAKPAAEPAAAAASNGHATSSQNES